MHPNFDVNPSYFSVNQDFWDKLVKLGSSHLVLPSIHGALLKKKSLYKIPEDLLLYLEEITKLNEERNNEILKQINFISELFIKNQIRHVFLKGAALLISEPFNTIGERMVGDIDILVDKDHLIRAKNILIQNHFKTKKIDEVKFIDKVKGDFSRHLQRLIHPDFIAAVELHEEILDFKYAKILSAKLILNNTINHQGYYVPKRKILWKHAILNWQYNDKGLLYNDLSFRTFVDVINLEPKEMNYKIIKETAICRFYSLCSILIPIYQNNNNIYSSLFNYKLIYPNIEILCNRLTKLVITFDIFYNRLILMLKSKNYRQVIFNNPRLLIKKIFVFLGRR